MVQGLNLRVDQEIENIEDGRSKLKTEILKSTEKNVGKIKKASKKHRTKEEILRLIGKCRKYKNTKDRQDKKDHRKLRNEVEKKKKMRERTKKKESEIENLMKKT